VKMTRTRTIVTLAALTVAVVLTVVGVRALPERPLPDRAGPSPAISSSAPSSTPSSAAPAATPAAGGVSLRGDTSPVHDPALHIDADGTWYVYATGRVNRENGGTIQIFSSRDAGTTWRYRGTVWKRIPAWIDRRFADGGLPDNLWAPEIHVHAGTYYLYYSASRFGTDESVTALATNTTLDPDDPDYRWVDRGLVVASPVTGLRGGATFNAIDPGVVEADGKPYLSIGSFWSGIFLLPLEWPSGKPVAGWPNKTVHLVDRQAPPNAVEGATLIRHGGYYYIFVSFDLCCRGADSTYRIVVGRSRSVTGPYRDKAGKPLLDGGGSPVLSRHGAVVGPGGQSVSRGQLAFHYYDAANRAAPYVPTLGIRPLRWSGGWPGVRP
jgi:arabinan endo-1,5-alpha-L-arabinosidase